MGLCAGGTRTAGAGFCKKSHKARLWQECDTSKKTPMPLVGRGSGQQRAEQGEELVGERTGRPLLHAGLAPQSHCGLL